MPENPRNPRTVYRFGPFELDVEERRLTRNGYRRRIQEKALQLLTLLVERPGEIVSRAELIEALWPGTVVDFERGLNTAVRKVRAALGESADGPGWLATVPRRGYRFTGKVERIPVRPAPGVPNGDRESWTAPEGLEATAAERPSPEAVLPTGGSKPTPSRGDDRKPRPLPARHEVRRQAPARFPNRILGPALALVLLGTALLRPATVGSPVSPQPPAVSEDPRDLELHSELSGLLQNLEPCAYCAAHFAETGRLYDCPWCRNRLRKQHGDGS